MKRLIIDTSSVSWTAMLAGQDVEGKRVEHEGRTVTVNSADYGYENLVDWLNDIIKQFHFVPTEIIFVVEGKMSKARRVAMYRGYKQGRESRPPEAYEQFNEMIQMVTTAYRHVGAHIVTQDGVEGDDVIAYLTRHLDGEKFVLSNDGDMSALIADDVHLIRKGELVTENPYGPFPAKYIRLFKALTGDGNEFKGAKGFGDKAFLNMLVTFGDAVLPALQGLIERKQLEELEEDVAEFKPFRKVIDSAEHVYESWACAGLYPEWVNTLRQPLQWQAGIVRGRDVVEDSRLHPWCQQVRLITAENYDEALKFMSSKLRATPVVSLDIETSTPPESDEWLAARGKEDKVDVFGSELTGLALTFGANGQYTFYFSVDHADTANVTSEQVLDAMRLIPEGIYTLVHNASFELPTLYGEWGKQWSDNGWHGFLPNMLDTAILSSYADENRSHGLKSLSSNLLDYQQVTYEQVTTIGEQQFKMNELSGEHVLAYGADDTICTMGVYHHFKMILEIENTWQTMLDVEQKTAYVKALAFHNGVKFSLETMLDQEREDREEYEQNWAVVREFLIEQGWEGTRCPVFEELTPANIKEAVSIVLGLEFKTQVRTPSKLAKLMLDEVKHPEIAAHEDTPLLAKLVEDADLAQINDWMSRRFSGEPVFDIGSPKQMTAFLYEMLGLPPRIVNKATANERANKPELARAIGRHKKIWGGSDKEPPLTDEEKALVRQKAKSDDTAVDFALYLDVEPGSQVEQVLHAFKRMKTCSTRQTMFYNAYKHLRHWRDNKIHGQAGQCRTVTRRDAPNDPNLGQLPKKGEGIKFRKNFLSHHKDAVVVTIDFAQQELRQGAGHSGDENMLSCFVGENKRDIHAMTAAGAMTKKWSKDKLDELIQRYGEKADDYEFFTSVRNEANAKVNPKDFKLADDLRKVAKNVNFGAQYDAQALTLAETIIIMPAEAQTFLDAKMAMFPRFEGWKEEIKEFVRRTGYAQTCMGARRHLRESVLSDNKWDMEKAMRQGPNFCIQGSSGEQIRLAQSALWDSGILFVLDMVFYFSVHDELVWSVHKDDAIASIKVMHEIMTRPYGDLPVPFNGSISVGLNFGNQVEMGEEVDEPALQETIESLFKQPEPALN